MNLSPAALTRKVGAEGEWQACTSCSEGSCDFKSFTYSSSFVHHFVVRSGQRPLASAFVLECTAGISAAFAPLSTLIWKRGHVRSGFTTPLLGLTAVATEGMTESSQKSFYISKIWPELKNINLFSGPKAAFVCGPWKQMLRNICFCQNTCVGLERAQTETLTVTLVDHEGAFSSSSSLILSEGSICKA